MAMYSEARPPTIFEVSRRLVPFACLDVVVPLVFSSVYYNNTTLDFTAWLLTVAVLDAVIPAILPTFESTNLKTRLRDILRLLLVWVVFQMIWYFTNDLLKRSVKGYSDFVCTAGLCWIRLIAPAVSIALFYTYLHFTGYRQDYIAPTTKRSDEFNGPFMQNTDQMIDNLLYPMDAVSPPLEPSVPTPPPTPAASKGRRRPSTPSRQQSKTRSSPRKNRSHHKSSGK